MPVDLSQPPVIGVGIGGLAVLALLGYLLVAFRPLHALAALLVRVRPEDLARHPRRRAILDLLAGAAPCTTREIAARTRSNYGTLVYHLRHLQKGGLVGSLAHGKDRVWFRPNERPSAARLALSKDPPLRLIVDAVRARPGLAPARLARDLDQPRSSVHRRVARLAGLGLVRVQRGLGGVRCYPTT